ncbi:hypothetical protein ACHAXT_013342 [Thalassiosira profunda]
MSEEPSLLNFVTNVVALAYEAPGDDRREVLGRALDRFTGGRYDIRFRGSNEDRNSAGGASTASPPAASPENRDNGEQIDAAGDGAEQIVGIARAGSAAGEEEAPSASSGAKSSVGDDDDDDEALFSDDKAVTLDDESGEGEGGDKGDKSNGEDSESDESSDEETVAVGSKGFFSKNISTMDGILEGCVPSGGEQGDKNRRVVYPDGDGEDLTLQQVRRLDEKARKAGKFVEEGWFDKEYSLRVGDVIECDDYAEPIEIFKDLPVGGKVVSIEVEDRAANKWKIVTDGKCHLTSEDDEIDVVSSEYHWVDAPKKGLRVKIRDLNLIPGKAAGWGGLEKLAGAAEDTAMMGKETRRSKRKQAKDSKDGEGGEQMKKSKKQK